MWRELDPSPEGPAAEAEDARAGQGPEPARELIDLRGKGVLGCLSDLLSTGEPVAVVCVDASRRRSLLGHELDPARFGRPPALVASAHCAPGTVDKLLGSVPRAAFCLVDCATIAEHPGLFSRFTHIFVLDPPPSERLSALLFEIPGPGAEPSFLHLGWGSAELEFTRQSLEQEYALRAPLTAVYRALREHPEGLSGAPLEAALAGPGRHPRSPALAGRCLRVLSELGLVELERSSATVRCTNSQGKVNLERSDAFQGNTRIYEEGLRFLNGPAQPMRSASAA